MKKVLLLAVLAASAAFAAQEAVKFERFYKLNDKDTTRITLESEIPQLGPIKVTVEMANEVKKLHTDGAADIDTSITDVKVVAAGQEHGTSPQQYPKNRIQKMSKVGIPVGESVSKGNIRGLDYIRFATILPAEPMQVGQTAEFSHKMDRTEIKGSTKLEKFENGTATLFTKMTISQPNNMKPVEMEFTSKVERETGKLDAAEGKLLVPDDPDMKNMRFKVERLR